MIMKDIGRLDLKALKNLVALKEKNQELLKLESHRERLRGQIKDVEDEIRTYTQSRPNSRALLKAIRSVAAGSAEGRRVRRPRYWLREKVTALLKAARKPQTPAQIRDAIAKSHPEQATKSLYISIFQLLKRNAEFKKIDNGWVVSKARNKK